MGKLKAILVDDELPSLQNLEQKLIEFCPDISIIAAIQKPEDAILAIEQNHPDVLFLDIEMPRMNGFKMLEKINEKDFEIVFTTAYNHYAIDALRISAFDYLVKPIAVKELQNSVNRLLETRSKQIPEKLEVLRQNLSDSRTQNDKITISTSEGVEFFEINQIIRIESSSNYSKIYFKDYKSIVVTKLLKDFEEILVPYRFYRIHNSHLINLSYIKRYIRGDGGQVLLQNNDIIDVSRRKKEEFLRLIS
ncbi:MAG: LytTR family DNA-binding domain-containing protein [Bacteroidota bacterium]|jgi:two-component system, LytTR family, response regulator|nr:LytTR family DNA-binding domain-containing protein [Bacteroidota bacterium]